MKYIKSLLITSLLVFGNIVSAQGDECTSATNLGSLPTPGPCVNGIQSGGSITQSGTTVGATAANPYVYQIGCQGQSNNMDFPANDVW